MPTVAAFVKIQDPNVTIPNPDTLINDLHFQFGLPGVSGSGILFFKLRPLGRSTFQFAINDSSPLSFSVDTSPTRSFHEIYPLAALREEDNSLTMAVSGDGRVVVSDIVVFYQMNI